MNDDRGAGAGAPTPQSECQSVRRGLTARVDKAAFARCLEQPQTQLAIQRDQDAAKQLGIRATPTLLINDRLVVGALSEEELQRWVEEALRAESATR